MITASRPNGGYKGSLLYLLSLNSYFYKMTIDANAAGTTGEYERSIFTVGILLLAAATFLLQKTIFGSHLDHIPLVRSDIGDAEKRWKVWERGAKELYREGCRQVGILWIYCNASANSEYSSNRCFVSRRLRVRYYIFSER